MFPETLFSQGTQERASSQSGTQAILGMIFTADKRWPSARFLSQSKYRLACSHPVLMRFSSTPPSAIRVGPSVDAPRSPTR